MPHCCSLYLLIDHLNASRRRLTTNEARNSIRRGRRYADEVQVHATTDRDGTPLHIGYVHFGPGHWTNVDNVTEIYEIPTVALTDL